MISNETYKKLLKKEKLHLTHLDESITKPLFLELVATDDYKAFLETNGDPAASHDILNYLYKKIMLRDEHYHQALEESFMNWWDDDYVVIKKLGQILKDTNAGSDPFKNMYEDIPDEKEFSKSLLLKLVKHDKELEQLIAPKLTNWDLDRVARIDMILIKLALCELLYFPTIPIKVSINEYMEMVGYNKERAFGTTEKIYDRTLDIIKTAKAENITTHAAALKMAEKRIRDIARIKSGF